MGEDLKEIFDEEEDEIDHEIDDLGLDDLWTPRHPNSRFIPISL